MVTLFIGLLDYAGLLPEKSPLRSAVRSARRERSNLPQEARRVARGANTASKRHQDPGSRKQTKDEAGGRETDERDDHAPLGLDPMIAGLIRRLPPVDAEWPAAKRRAWLRAAEAAFDVLYELPAGDSEEVIS